MISSRPARDIPALLEYIASRRDEPHNWQRPNDCVSFSLLCVKAQTGRDLLADIPVWSSRKEALTIARDLGGLAKAYDREFTRIPVAMAQRGDIAGLPDKAFGVRFMIVEGKTLVGPGTDRQERLPRSAMVRSWSALLPAGFGDG
ncbi:MAG: hypothetical protein AAF494_01675 [Pseudomonadota bacterium]